MRRREFSRWYCPAPNLIKHTNHTPTPPENQLVTALHFITCSRRCISSTKSNIYNRQQATTSHSRVAYPIDSIRSLKESLMLMYISAINFNLLTQRCQRDKWLVVMMRYKSMVEQILAVINGISCPDQQGFLWD